MATPYGVLPTASGLMDQPMMPQSPFGPAGITDAQKFGWLTQLQGLGQQMPATQQYANNMGNLANQATNTYNQGGFGWNPYMGGAYGMAQGAPNQPGFGAAANAAGNTLGRYGGGWSGQMANTINQTGASFNPMNQYLTGMVGEANKQLGRDFNQQVMPAMNRAAIASGSGGYGGTRAGVAQGVREQGLADAMQRQTTQMLGQGYEAGLGRYVQDRGNTLATTLGALSQGGQLGMQGAQLFGNLANMQGGLANQAAGTMGQLGTSSQQMNNAMFNQLPGFLGGAFEAGRAPGQLTGQFGGMLGDIGAGQQGQNQRMLDWYNQQYNGMQQMPWDRAGQYAGMISPWTMPGNIGAVNSQTPVSPLGGALTGAGLGFGWANQYGNQPQTPTAPGGLNPNYSGSLGGGGTMPSTGGPFG